MNSSEALASLLSSFSTELRPLGDDSFLLVSPIEGLDSHRIHFYAKSQPDGWSLSDGGHLLSELDAFGVSEDKIRTRFEAYAQDLPLEISADGELMIWLPRGDTLSAQRLLSRAIAAILGTWALRVDQALPTERISIAERLADRVVRLRPTVEVRRSVSIDGASRIPRRFDLQIGPPRGQGFHLVRTSDTRDRTQLAQNAELYLVYADDLRRLPGYGDRWRFFFLWNEASAALDRRVRDELVERNIRPLQAGDTEGAAETILADVVSG